MEHQNKGAETIAKTEVKLLNKISDRFSDLLKIREETLDSISSTIDNILDREQQAICAHAEKKGSPDESGIVIDLHERLDYFEAQNKRLAGISKRLSELA